MKIKLLNKTMIKNVIYPVGSVLSVDDEQASLWIKQGRAVELAEPEKHEVMKRKPRKKKQ
jgi:hypothetical protein